MAVTELLIGAADLYGWDKVKQWVISARQSGYDKKIALLCYRVEDDVLENAPKWDVDLYLINYDAFGQPIQHNTRGRDTQCHQLRFFHAWQLLDDVSSNTNVIMTDVRDVIFQKNPAAYVDEFIQHYDSSLLCSSEDVTFGTEPWNTNNLVMGFGPFMFEKMKEWEVMNVGVLAGNSYIMKSLFLNIFNTTYGRYIPSDQSTFNILLRGYPLRDVSIITTHYSEWACQCGTTLDPEKSSYRPHLLSPPPHIKEDNKIYNHRGQLFHVVHQWDRVPELKKTIEERY